MMIDDRRRECDAAFYASYEQDARDAEVRMQHPTTSRRTQRLFYALGAAWTAYLKSRGQLDPLLSMTIQEEEEEEEEEQEE